MTRLAEALTLLERDVRNAPWRRFLLGALLVLAFQGLTAVASRSPEREIQWPAAFFFLWVFGFLAGIAVSFDLVSSERESHSLDLVLTSGVARWQVVGSKVAVTWLLAAALAIGFVAETTLAYAPFVGVAAAAGVWAWLVPVWLFFVEYAFLGLSCSILFRSSKVALLAAFSASLALRPRLCESVAAAVCRWLGLGPQATAALQALSPEIALCHTTGIRPTPGERHPDVALLVAIGVLVLMIAAAFRTFSRQDEPAYGD